MNGKLQEKTLLKNYPISWVNIAEAALMFIFGAIAIILHAKFKSGMKIPGHHGIEFMALMLAGRSITRIKFSSMFFSIGVASMIFMPFVGFRDPFMAFVFTVPGIALDIFTNMNLLKSKYKIVIIALAGFSYALIPIVRFIITGFTPVKYPSLIGGPVYPFFTHFVSAAIGAAIGIGAISLIKKLSKKTK